MKRTHLKINKADTDMVEIWADPRELGRDWLLGVMNIDAVSAMITDDTYNLLIEKGEVKVKMVM